MAPNVVDYKGMLNDKEQNKKLKHTMRPMKKENVLASRRETRVAPYQKIRAITQKTCAWVNE